MSRRAFCLWFPGQLYDGATLSFEDKSFDLVFRSNVHTSRMSMYSRKRAKGPQIGWPCLAHFAFGNPANLEQLNSHTSM